jgi:hypothetical protein
MSKGRIFIGIDNGLNGALCAMRNSKILEKIVMPTISISDKKTDYDIQRIVEFIKKFEEPFIVIEKAQALPGPGNVQMFSLGRGYGIMTGIVAALGYQYQIVHPKTWQTKLFRDVDKSDTKKASVYVAKRLFPKEDFRATERSKKDHDGLTDSALLAYYGQNFFNS